MLPSTTQPLSASPEQQQTPSRRYILTALLFVTLIAGLIFFTDLGKFPMFNPDEGLYAEPAREMLETNEYITTYLNYVVRYTKPPLVIWLMVAAFKVFGVNEFSSRCFEALSAVLLIATTYLFSIKYTNKRTAAISTLILCTSAVFIGTGREAITDMPLSLFIAGAMFALYHAFKTNRSIWSYVACGLLGLAVMTKGPVAVVLALGILLPFHLLTGSLAQAYRAYKPVVGAFIVAIISIPWYAVEIYKTHGEYFQQFIMVENVQRFTSVVDHKAPWWYHFAVVLGGLFPWSIFFPIALYRVATEGIESFRSKTASEQPSEPIDKAHSEQPARDPITNLLAKVALYAQTSSNSQLKLFLALTGVVVVSFFSIAVSKLLPYTVPAFPAMALLIGMTIDDFINEKRWKVFAILFGSIAVISVASLLGLSIVAHKLRDCPPELLKLIPVAMGTVSASALVAAVLAWSKRISASIYTLTASMIAITMIFGFKILHMVSADWEEPVKNFSLEYGPTKLPIVVFGMRKPSITFYAKRPIIFPKGEDELDDLLKKTPEAVVLIKSKDEKLFADNPGAKLIRRDGRYLIYQWQSKG